MRPGGNHTVNTPRPGGNHIVSAPRPGGNHVASNPHPGGNHIVSTQHSRSNHTVSAPKAVNAHQNRNNGGGKKKNGSLPRRGKQNVPSQTDHSHPTPGRRPLSPQQRHTRPGA